MWSAPTCRRWTGALQSICAQLPPPVGSSLSSAGTCAAVSMLACPLPAPQHQHHRGAAAPGQGAYAPHTPCCGTSGHAWLRPTSCPTTTAPLHMPPLNQPHASPLPPACPFWLAPPHADAVLGGWRAWRQQQAQPEGCRPVLPRLPGAHRWVLAVRPARVLALACPAPGSCGARRCRRKGPRSCRPSVRCIALPRAGLMAAQCNAGLFNAQSTANAW